MSNKIPQAEKDLVPYLETLGLHDLPFSADPRSCKPYIDAEWQQYLHQILHLAQTSDLILAIVAEKGLGKTTLIDLVIDNLPDNIRHCRIRIEANQGAQGLLNQWAECLDLPPNLQPAAMLPLIDEQARLLRRYDQILLLVLDDAHLLSPEALNMLRYMQEGSDQGGEGLPWKILLSIDPAHMTQFMLYGEKMHFIQLAPFTEKQTAAYLLHRLRNAGLQGELPLSAQEVEFIHKISKGIPAEMHALAHARLLELEEIPTLASPPHADAKEESTHTVPEIPHEFLKNIRASLPRRTGMLILGGVIVALILVAVFFQQQINSLFQGTPGELKQSQAVRETLKLPEQQEYLLKSIPYPVPRISTPVPRKTESMHAEVPAQASQAEKTPAPAPKLSPQPSPQPPPESPQQTAQVNKEPITNTPVVQAAVKPETAPIQNLSPTPKKAEPALQDNTESTPYHGKEWILQQDPKHFTLQLMGSSKLTAVANIARSPRLHEQASIYKILRNGQDWYVLLYGVYNSRSEAKAAITDLPAGLRKNTPWLRPYADVQQEIRAGKK